MSKGKRRERECAEIFENAGFRTYRPQESKWGETDIFGLFDILAVPGPGELGQVRLIQVKSNGARGIESWAYDALQHASNAVRTQFAVCYDREGWRLIEPIDHGGGVDWRTVCDERQDDTIGPNQHTDRSIGDGLAEFLENGSQPEDSASC